MLERLFRGFKFELPSTAIKSFAITPSTIDDPVGELRELLKQNSDAQRTFLKSEVQDFAQRFRHRHGFELVFADDAIAALVEESLARDKTIRGLCEDKFRDFHHGLTLVSRNSGTTSFAITRTVVQNPEKELSRWVVASFRPEEPGAATAGGSPAPAPPSSGG